MDRKLNQILGVILLSAVLMACSSPEEKAAEYIENAKTLFAEGKIKKAEIEYRNALQINQNLPEVWFGLAKIYERRQEWRKSYAALNKNREIAPTHANSRIMLAKILLASNQIDQALTDATEIMELVPGDARAHSLMAAVQFRLENYKAAQTEVDNALAIDSANIEALLVRARVLITQKEYDQAIKVLDGALASNPDHVSFYLMKIQAYQESSNEKAIEGVYKALIKQFPENNIAYQNALARLYISRNDINEAENIIQQIVSSNPDNIDEKMRYVAFKNRHRSAEDAINLVESYINENKEEFRFRFLQGDLFENNGMNERALGVYQQIVNDDELQPNGIEARNKIAKIELRSGNRNKARELVDEVLSQDKSNENALLLLTGFQISEKNYDDALVSARTVLRDNPDSIKALGLLGQAYEASGSTELAVESYTKAFQINPGTSAIANQLASIFIRQRKYSQADEILQQSLSRGNRSLDAIKLLAQVKISLGEWDVAEKLANQLKQVEGQEALSQQVLGAAYLGKELPEEGIEAFKRAHALAPAAAQPLVALVQTYVRSGKIADAQRFLNSVVSENNENITAYTLLTEISLIENKTPEAIEYLNKIIEINPNAEFAYRGLANIYLRDNEFDKAEAAINRGLTAMPDRTILVLSLASIYEQKNEFEKAIELYEKLLATNPNYLVAKNNFASLLTDHRTDQASLDKARTISAELKSSQLPQFRDTYAWAAVKSGINVEEAVAILEGIVKENEQVDVYNYHLGEAYRKKGEIDNAVAYLKKAAELAGPGSDITDKANQSLQQIK